MQKEPPKPAHQAQGSVGSDGRVSTPSRTPALDPKPGDEPHKSIGKLSQDFIQGTGDKGPEKGMRDQGQQGGPNFPGQSDSHTQERSQQHKTNLNSN